MLVAPSFYETGEYVIPNAVPMDAELNDGLIALIDRAEGELALNLLGRAQYDQYAAVLPYHVLDKYGPEHLQDNFCVVIEDDDNENARRTTPGFNVPTLQSADWKDLLYGSGGLEKAAKLYVYTQWVRQDETKVGGHAVGRGASDAVTPMDTSHLFTKAFNEFVLCYHDAREFIAKSEVFQSNPDGEVLGDLLTAEFGVWPSLRNSFGL